MKSMGSELSCLLLMGDEVMASLRSLVANDKIIAAQFTAIGALRSARLAYFDWENKSHEGIPVSGQIEVASLIGDVTVNPDGCATAHAHAVLGCRDGGATAGNLEAGQVRPLLECVMTESPAHLQKRFDRESGLALIRLSEGSPRASAVT